MKVKNAVVQVQAPTAGAVTSEGLQTFTWATVATLVGTLIPFGDEDDTVQTPPGYVILHWYKFFYKGRANSLIEGNRLLLEDGGAYPILKVLDYDRILEVRVGGPGA